MTRAASLSPGPLGLPHGCGFSFSSPKVGRDGAEVCFLLLSWWPFYFSMAFHLSCDLFPDVLSLSLLEVSLSVGTLTILIHESPRGCCLFYHLTLKVDLAFLNVWKLNLLPKVKFTKKVYSKKCFPLHIPLLSSPSLLVGILTWLSLGWFFSYLSFCKEKQICVCFLISSSLLNKITVLCMILSASNFHFMRSLEPYSTSVKKELLHSFLQWHSIH